MFITFEGIDGSGKSTQIHLLDKYLTDKGFSVHVFRDPGGAPLSEELRHLLLNSDREIDSVAELLLFSAARAQLITEKVQRLLQQDHVVILDRYYDSTVAYQGYGRASLPLDDIRRLNEIASHGFVPDITFYLQLTLEEARRRTSHHSKDRMERSGREFYKKVIRGFNDLAINEERFNAIDATGSAGQIHQKILRLVNNFLTGD